MLTEDYCSYEVAKLLKERGFSENTICKYADSGGITERWYDDYRERVVRFHFDKGYLIEPSIEPKDQYEIIGNTISAPTHQMAMKWLREVYDIHISVNKAFLINDIDNKPYLACVCTKKCHTSYNSWQEYHRTYEEAVEAALKYCLADSFFEEFEENEDLIENV